MRKSSPVLVLTLFAAAVAGCSRKPADHGKLDLMLNDVASRAPVVSAIELGGEAKAKPVSVARTGVDAPMHAHRKARTRHLASVLHRAPRAAERAPMVVREPDDRAVAVAPAPAPAPAPAQTTAPDPAPTQQPSDQPARGRGGWPAPTDGGIHFPGFPGGGVIIIRGGHGGMDPCDEHGHGMGGGFPGMPGGGMPAGIGRGFPGGGIRFILSH